MSENTTQRQVSVSLFSVPDCMEIDRRTGAQVRVHKADIPPDMSQKAIQRINEGMDKFVIEKVCMSPSPHPACTVELTVVTAGYCYLREEEKRRRVRRDVALRYRPKFWLLHNP